MNGPELLNTIRDNASAEYQSNVPVATMSNLADVGNPILSYSSVQNEFINTIVNKIAKTIVESKVFNNRLAFLKKGTTPLGNDTEILAVNPAADKGYTTTQSNLLTTYTPEVAAEYLRMNRQSKYTQTISNRQLQQAFTSFGALESLIAGIANSLYSGDAIDEWKLMKGMIGTAADETTPQIVTQTVTAPTDKESSDTFLTAVRKTSLDIEMPGSSFNRYKALGGSFDFVGWTEPSRKVVMMTTQVASVTSVNSLAYAFNMDKADFLGRQVVIDSFGTGAVSSKIQAAVFDESYLQVYDNLSEFGTFYDIDTLRWHYYWHHWQTYSILAHANAVAFVTA